MKKRKEVSLKIIVLIFFSVLLYGCCTIFPHGKNCPPLTNISPTTLDFGERSLSMSFSITNTGGGNLNWIANPSEPWITLSHNSGDLRPMMPYQVTVTINRNLVSEGSHSGTVQINTTTGVSVVNISMIKPPLPPEPSLVIDRILMNETPQTGTWLMCFMAVPPVGDQKWFNIPDHEYEKDNITITMNLEVPNIKIGQVMNWVMQLDDDQEDVCGNNVDDRCNGNFTITSSGNKYYYINSEWKFTIYWHTK
jgi:hypothetical protein